MLNLLPEDFIQRNFSAIMIPRAYPMEEITPNLHKLFWVMMRRDHFQITLRSKEHPDIKT